MCVDLAGKKEEEKPAVRVGVSTVLMNDKGEFLMGKRIGSHGASESPSIISSLPLA